MSDEPQGSGPDDEEATVVAGGGVDDREAALAARERAVAARERAQDAASVARQRTGEFPAVDPSPSPAAASATPPPAGGVPEAAPATPPPGPEPAVVPQDGPASDGAQADGPSTRDRAHEAAAAARERGAEWRERTGELAAGAGERISAGATVAREQAGRAASYTAGAVRQTDVGEIARRTNTVVERTRPFFLLVVAVIFTLIAVFEGTARVATVFAVGAVIAAIFAAFAAPIEGILRRAGGRDEPR